MAVQVLTGSTFPKITENWPKIQSILLIWLARFALLVLYSNFLSSETSSLDFVSYTATNELSNYN